jgi:hypothetical protein
MAQIVCMKYKVYLILFFLFSANLLNGQVLRSFTADSVVYIEELNSLFNRITIKDNKADALQAIEVFQTYWNSDRVDSTLRNKIYDLSNQMLSRRIKSYPHFMLFIRSLNGLLQPHHDQQLVHTWLEGAGTTLQSGTRSFSSLLEFIVPFLEDNILYESRIFNWWADSRDYSFSNDSVFHIIFPKTNLFCANKSDSTTIFETGGVLFPADNLWVGKSGSIYWDRAGLDRENTFARLENYTISLRSAGFVAEPVAFYDLKYFLGPIAGKIEEKVSSNVVTPENALYPHFQSYEKTFFIADIFSDIDYEGGFDLKGAKIQGTGDAFSDARLTFKRPYRDKSGKYDQMVARSKIFIIEPDRINASKAAITIFHQDDSIYHSGVRLRYMHEKREVSLLRTEKGLMESPYYNTFHRIEIDSEAIYWRMDEPEMRFRSLLGVQPQSQALFVSDNFFEARQYNLLQGIDDVNPLITINTFARDYNTRRFMVSEMAAFMRVPENMAEAQIIRLAKLGFLYYDLESKQAFITDKLNHYIDARYGRKDYDVIAFLSQVENSDNATLSLENFDLKIHGVPKVSLSDSQNVYIYPTEQELILRKNRDFVFSGIVQAGLFEFMASDCLFEYDSFRLNLPTIDFMRFKVRAFDDKEGERNLVDVKTVVSDISGELLIDKPDNKNGLVNNPRYPIFSSQSESFVYYDNKPEFEQAYNRERFYYNLKPFTIESLTDFSTDEIRFDGYLNSGGIFNPEVTKPLSVMPDYSLGFKISSGENGFPVYGNKAIFRDSIFLSNSGLMGSGTIEYLNTVMEGKDMMFFLDSVNATLDRFELAARKEPQNPFPSVSGKNLSQHWLPYSDSLMLATNDSLLVMFDDVVKMKGSLTYTPELLTGSGKLLFFTAQTNAEKYIFGNDDFSSPLLDLAISDFDDEAVSLKASKFAANVDFSTNTGNFTAQTDTIPVELPAIRYSLAMKEFDWLMNRNRVAFRNNAKNSDSDFATLSLREMIDVTPDGARITSLHPLQDSLWFYATEAELDIALDILQVKDVKYIKVADAAVFPGDGHVEIKEDASITPLANAMILADTSNKVHLITEAVVNIESRYSYRANGLYAYRNAMGDSEMITFNEIRVDTTYQTVANGHIALENDFRFSPQFGYRGNVALNARNPLLDFDGAYMIAQDCDPGLSRWVSFHNRIDPDSLVFPVDQEPEEFAYKKLYAGFFHSNEENRVYPAFLSRKSYYSDTLMLSVNGAIKARKMGKEFLIADSSQINIDENLDPYGPYMKFNSFNCRINAAGKINLGADFRHITLESFGLIDHYVIPDSTIFRTFLAVDFMFEDEAMEFMQQSIARANKPGIEPSNPVTDIAYLELLGNDGASDLIYNLSLFGTLRKVPDALNKSIILSDVTFTYNPDRRSFISQGPVGVGMIKGVPVNKYVDGYVEIVRRRSGDVISIYLELDRRHWYYFTFSGNLMQAISSKNEFNAILAEVESDKRKAKRQDNETAYRYIISTVQNKNRFLRAVRESEFNEED